MPQCLRVLDSYDGWRGRDAAKEGRGVLIAVTAVSVWGLGLRRVRGEGWQEVDVAQEGIRMNAQQNGS